VNNIQSKSGLTVVTVKTASMTGLGHYLSRSFISI